MNNNFNKGISPFVVGPPVDNLFGREDKIDTFFNRLNTSQMHSQRILGAQHSGKTSFLRHIANPKVYMNRIQTSGLPVVLVYVDLQASISEPLLFFRAVASAIIETIPDDKTIPVPDAFSYVRDFDIWFHTVYCRYRVVVLLDSFEVLAQSEKFDLDFFGKLRSLASSKLIWVTASYRDVVTLSKPPGKRDLSSPLFTVFYSEPIYMGPLETDASRELITKPAKSQGIAFSENEIGRILELSGKMPFLLQAISDKWFLASVNGTPENKRNAYVIEQLFTPGVGVREHLYRLWKSLSFKGRRILTYLANNRSIPQNNDYHDHLIILENFGFITQENGTYKLAADIFERWILNFSDQTPGIPHIFIGHGHNALWYKVKEFIEKDLGLKAVYYESDPHAGESIVPILNEMIDKAEFAIIVMTGEDIFEDKSVRARQNVVHEAGLFQGRLGFEKTVLIVQERVEFLSNLDGMQCINFSNDDIVRTFHELQAVLRRENLIV